MRRRPQEGVARVDRRTKDLIPRLRPGDVAVIDHEDIDRVAAEALVSTAVSAVVNASASISGRYPNLGPLILAQAGVPLVDTVGPLLLEKVREGDRLRLDGDRIYVGERLAAVGLRQSTDSILRAMDAAKGSLDERFESFAANTLEYMHQERDLLFGGAGLPELDHDLDGRPVLVVVRGYDYREDLAALRGYIRDIRPVLVGVDGGADALLDEGYRPDLIIGDMDSVSDRALLLGRPRRGSRRPTELILHAYSDGRAPGRERLEALGVPYKPVKAVGTSEDLAFLLAHERRAELIVAVGTHGNLREFLDKGRDGMSSTFLVRLRVGEILMDAKGVSRVYGGRSFRARDAFLLVGSALFAMLVVVLISPPLRLYFDQLFEQVRQALFDLKEVV
ncbi:MAG: putative cytokinetic ring protein SteA [Actinomycetota bacterium]